MGSGSGGSVTASRLSEVPEWKVLVLEAGGLPPQESYVPGLVGLGYFRGNNNWDYVTEPQRHGLRNFVERVSVGRRPVVDVCLYVHTHTHTYRYTPIYASVLYMT